jgi:hypothetical protein
MAEVEAEGGQVSVVAQRHGISKSLLYNWRSAWKAAGLAARARAVAPAEFVQLGVVADPSGQGPMMPMTTGAVCPRGTGLALAELVGVMPMPIRARRCRCGWSSSTAGIVLRVPHGRRTFGTVCCR